MSIDKALRIVRNPHVSNLYPSQKYGNIGEINFNSDRNNIAEKVMEYMPFDTSGIWNIIKYSGLVSKFFNWLKTVVGPVLGWLSRIVSEGAFTYLLAGVGNAFLSASRNLPQRNSLQQNHSARCSEPIKPFVSSNGSGFVSKITEAQNISINPVSEPSWLHNTNIANKFKF